MAKSEIVALSTEAVDVLCISFSPDTLADDSELTDNDIVIRYKNGKIIGLPVLHFSERHKQKAKSLSKS